MGVHSALEFRLEEERPLTPAQDDPAVESAVVRLCKALRKAEGWTIVTHVDTGLLELYTSWPCPSGYQQTDLPCDYVPARAPAPVGGHLLAALQFDDIRELTDPELATLLWALRTLAAPGNSEWGTDKPSPQETLEALLVAARNRAFESEPRRATAAENAFLRASERLAATASSTLPFSSALR